MVVDTPLWPSSSCTVPGVWGSTALRVRWRQLTARYQLGAGEKQGPTTRLAPFAKVAKTLGSVIISRKKWGLAQVPYRQNNTHHRLGGGSVQHDLSAANHVLAFCAHCGAADKR